MTIKQIISNRAPAAIGPYSQAVTANRMIFCSGTLGIDPVTGMLVAGGLESEMKQVLKNLDAVLREAGATPKDVVKTTVFMADLNQFAKMNELYAGFFSAPYPARSTFQVATLPKSACIEIEAVAVLPDDLEITG